LAVDTEAASFHRYVDRIYLIQLSTREMTAIIDPVAVEDMTPLGAVLSNRTREIVFHDADYDLRLFDLQYQFRPNTIFDTRIAAQFLNEPGIGLAALLEKYLGVTADKKYQRADWSARPLKTEMLAYAAMDTRHLIQVRDILHAQLEEKGRLEWVTEEFASLEEVRYTGGDDKGTNEAWLKFKGARTLSPRGLAVLRELYQWREQTARKLDRAAFRVMNNEPILAMAEQPPRSLDELAQVKGVGREGADRRGREVLAAVERGLTLPDDQLPRFPRPERRKPDPVYEARLERLKATRNALAKEYDLAPGVLCPNGTLEAIAHAAPKTVAELRKLPEVRKWQAKEFGERLVGVVGDRG
ncbi:MAG TPA: ribonuclease D, partial [Gemmatimonadales bacterium]|nr:ribonuclease D [Gemmatimonadales bacterium]